MGSTGGDLAGGMVVLGAPCLAGWVLWLATRPRSPRSRSDKELGAKGSRQLPGQRSNLWRQAGVARHPGGRRRGLHRIEHSIWRRGKTDALLHIPIAAADTPANRASGGWPITAASAR